MFNGGHNSVDVVLLNDRKTNKNGNLVVDCDRDIVPPFLCFIIGLFFIIYKLVWIIMNETKLK